MSEPAPPVVFYTEDNQILVQLVTDVLELLGCRVAHYPGGVLAFAALKSVKERRAHYDLLLLDNDTPQMSGLEVVRLARQMPYWKKTPIILVSIEDCRKAALEAGADELLRKPNNLITLVDVVRRLLSKAERGKAKGKS
ncbi:MAG TPA: response regulator [Pyrinomonadaceae bacterium]